MRKCCLFWMIFVTGCGSIVGTWEGECEVQVGNDLYVYEVEVEVESVEKGDINGAGTLIDEDNNRSQGTLDGSKEGSVLDFDIEFDDDDESKMPVTPKLGKPRKGAIKKIHALGDLHGWAPGLINYLISNKLATIDVDGQSLGANGKLDQGMAISVASLRCNRNCHLVDHAPAHQGCQEVKT